MKVGHLGTVDVYLRSDVDCEIQRLKAGWLLLTCSCLIIRQFLELKTSCFSANLWRANLFFLFGFVRPMFLTFFCVDEV